MSSLVIRGGRKLSGSIRVAGMKNAVLPLMAACLLTEDECTLENVPKIKDVVSFIDIIKELGAVVSWKDHVLKISAKGLAAKEPNPDLVRKFRASILLMGPLLARFSRVKMPFPGGDIIGARPIDTHLFGISRLGVKITENSRDIVMECRKMAGATIVLPESSVTGTENLLLAAVKARGKTVIKLAATEPHVQELAIFLNKMGGKITGHGTSTITIEGVERLRGTSHRIIPDQIESGTFACLAAATRSEIEIQSIEPDHLDAMLILLDQMGVNYQVGHTNLYVKPPKQMYRGNTIQSGLYPKLASDILPPFAILATQAKGTSLVHDWMYEGRMGYMNELIKMGANAIIADPHRALITGPTPLHGTEINGLDIRAGITLVIAGLVAEGTTTVHDAHHVDRGYEQIEERLRALGADITRVEG